MAVSSAAAETKTAIFGHRLSLGSPRRLSMAPMIYGRSLIDSSHRTLYRGMMSGFTFHEARRLPALEPVKYLRTLWRMASPTGRPITCALYRTSRGYELRAGEGEDDRLLCQQIYTDRAAEGFAETWKAAAKSKGFSEVALSENPQSDGSTTLSCPACCAWQGRIRYVASLPRQPGALVLTVNCEECAYTWTVTRVPELPRESVRRNTLRRCKAKGSDA